MRIIKDRRIVEDQWQFVKPGEDGTFPDIQPYGDIVVPLNYWLVKRDELIARKGRVGIWLESHQEPELLAHDIDWLPLIAVSFPAFSDGRGYSLGRLLRERYRFKGELRAIGDVLRDQIFYLHRCGFNAFAVRADKKIDDALDAFNDFSDAYQASVVEPLPLFRRRLSGTATK